MSLISPASLIGQQQEAVFSQQSAIAVTAGAGSGKTRSLVGRYLHLLARGYPLRSLLAITFTEKAAREMRARIRPALAGAPSAGDSSTSASFASLDAARIGTIHSLCAEILRLYPAEAGLDPGFEVLEEGLAAALQAEALETALRWAADDPASAALFGALKESELRQALGLCLAQRLEMQPLRAALSAARPAALLEEFETSLQTYLAQVLDAPAFRESLSELAARRARKADDKLELARREALARWNEASAARAAKDWDALLAALRALCAPLKANIGRKDAWDEPTLLALRQAISDLKSCYEVDLKFLAEGARFALDQQAADLLPALLRLFDQVLAEYQSRKDARQALDFDDLEGRAARLLREHPAVCASLQTDLRAVLVDEFQDTNERQRQIVYALAGFDPSSRRAALPGQSVDLFVVGDAKQSIYKFRGADVSVFRQVQRDIAAAGGQRLALDLTFRAHHDLLEPLNALLSPVLGTEDDPARPYLIPFAPLRAHRTQPARPAIRPPYIEIHLGLGEDAEAGRQAAAAALAARLCRLREAEGFAWGDMALLFRASSAFAVYEAALEAAGVPFVTVAGRGFYDRPEIRDLLNALAAIADPADDLALFGLLRSPAFALSDAEIYQLRCSPQGEMRPLGEALRASPMLAHTRAYAILSELSALAGRAPASAVLKRLLDLTGYRAMLASIPHGARRVRNVEKLLADAHRSRLTSLPAFLAYVRTLRDVGLREGEAAADANAASGGAVQLMTVHKAKGLEFPLVGLADASHEAHSRSARLQLSAAGLRLDLKEGDFHPTAWQIASRLEEARQEAEDCRLLYVAATRASEKLLISGHVKARKDGGLITPGWLGKLGLGQLQLDAAMRLQGEPPCEGVSLHLALDASPGGAPLVEPSLPTPAAAPLSDLLDPLTPAPPLLDEKARAGEADPPPRVWRVAPARPHPRAPAWVVGKLVHSCLQRWKFPAADFDAFLRPFALEAGLIDPGEIHTALGDARRLLQRLRDHPLYAELDRAERHHEVPYFTPAARGAEASRGVIDLLCRLDGRWRVIDFKTDYAASEDEARLLIRQNDYDGQAQRYVQAVQDLLGFSTSSKLNVETPHQSVSATRDVDARLVFLNVAGKLAIFDLQPPITLFAANRSSAPPTASS